MDRSISPGAGVSCGVLCAITCALIVCSLLLLCACSEGPEDTIAAASERLQATSISSTAITEPSATAAEPRREVERDAPTPHKVTAASASPPVSPGQSLALANETTLGASTPVCVGDGLFVAEDGVVHTLGRRDEQVCASMVDLATGVVIAGDPQAFPEPFRDQLQASDKGRARVYEAKNGAVLSFDCCGRTNGAVLMRPQAAQPDLSTDTALRFDERGARLHLSYQDYDGQNWITSVDLVSGDKRVDVPVLTGPWALTVDEGAAPVEQGRSRLVFADETALIVLDGADLTPVRRLALSRQPIRAVVDPKGARLFVTDAGGDLHVLDAVTLQEEQHLPGVGTAIDLDAPLGRLYVGDRYSGGVNIFDLTTLEPLGHIAQPGEPVASPADGQVYILEEDVYQADGAALEIVRGRTMRKGGCESCVYPAGLVVDPESGAVFTITGRFSEGKPDVSELVAIDPSSGHAYVARRSGDESAYSLTLYRDLSESTLLQSVDGLFGGPHGGLLFNPVRGQLYLTHDGHLNIIDGETLELLGSVDVGEGVRLLAIDGVTGALYAAQGERLLRFK